MTEIRYMGALPDRGEIDLRVTPTEGYAILSCGGTTILIGATSLHNLSVDDNPALSIAIKSVVAEALSGNTPQKLQPQPNRTDAVLSPHNA